MISPGKAYVYSKTLPQGVKELGKWQEMQVAVMQWIDGIEGTRRRMTH